MRNIFPPQAATTAVRSMTLSMNPLEFQLGVGGCASPLAAGASHHQHLRSPARRGEAGLPLAETVLAFILAELSFCQLLPPSLEKSTRDTPVSPPNAMPRASVEAPTCSVSPALIFVMKDRGTIRLIGTDLLRVSLAGRRVRRIRNSVGRLHPVIRIRPVQYLDVV